LVNAEGKVGESWSGAKQSPWMDYVGTLDGETVGVTIMDHPGSKHPFWHSRDYGLHARIFSGTRFFNDKTRDGSMTRWSRGRPGDSVSGGDPPGIRSGWHCRVVRSTVGEVRQAAACVSDLRVSDWDGVSAATFKRLGNIVDRRLWRTVPNRQKTGF
jgi:hypothetical protein